MPPDSWVLAPMSALVPAKLGAVKSPLTTCGVICVAPMRKLQGDVSAAKAVHVALMSKALMSCFFICILSLIYLIQPA
jgi:hypothetical protein